MQHFLSTADWSQEQLNGLLKLAAELKQDPVQDILRGKSIALMFLNPSMRTGRLLTWGCSNWAVSQSFCSPAKMHGVLNSTPAR